jgi:hypothetical protein
MNDDTGVIDVAGPIAKRLTFAADRPDLPALGRFTREAELLEIDSQESYEFAADRLVDCRRQYDALEGRRMDMARPINQIKDVLQSWFNPILSDNKAAQAIYKQKMGAHETAQRKITADHQAELDKAAREKRDADLAKAKALEKKDPELAAVIRENVAVAVPVVAVSTFVQTKGTVVSKIWKARLDAGPVDELALLDAKLRVIKFIAANPDYLYLVDINEAKCNSLAKQVKARMPVDGLVSYEDEIRSQRSAT